MFMTQSMFIMSQVVPKAMLCLNHCVCSAELHRLGYCPGFLLFLPLVCQTIRWSWGLLTHAWRGACSLHLIINTSKLQWNEKHELYISFAKKEQWNVLIRSASEKLLSLSKQRTFLHAHSLAMIFLPLLGEIILFNAALPSQSDFESTLLSLTQLLMVN